MNSKKKISVLPNVIITFLGAWHAKGNVACFDEKNEIESKYVNRLERRTARLKNEMKINYQNKNKEKILTIKKIEAMIPLLESKEVGKNEMRRQRQINSLIRAKAEAIAIIETEKAEMQEEEQVLEQCLKELIDAYSLGVKKISNMAEGRHV